MTLTNLSLRNLRRNTFRAVLTVAGVAVTIFVFLVLRTVLSAWANGAERAAKDRIVTRDKVIFEMSLPKHYVDLVREAPHVRAATWANWFGGHDSKHEREFLSTFAVDADTYFTVYDDMAVPPDQLEAWKHDKQGVIVGDVLARRFGWKVGDALVLRGGTGYYPGDFSVKVDGIYTAVATSVDRSTLCLHWDYVNDSLPSDRRDRVGWIVSRVDDPTRAADIGVSLDRRFDDADTPTQSRDEHSFNASLVSMFSAILKAMDLVSAVILVIMMLILGNTIAMSVRERTNEYGVLRAIGFQPGHVALWVVCESLALALLGGAVGVALAYPFINYGVSPFIEQNMATYFPRFRIEALSVLASLGLAALIGVGAATLPALRASRLRVVDAMRNSG